MTYNYLFFAWRQIGAEVFMEVEYSSAFCEAVKVLRGGKPVNQGVDLIDELTATEMLPSTACTQRIEFLRSRLSGSASVLDMGCGKGEIAHFLQLAEIPVLGLEREKDFIDCCRGRGVDTRFCDMNDLDDPSLNLAMSANWGAMIAIDTIMYWKHPAVVLSALRDRVGKIIVSAGNIAHINNRIDFLLGQIKTYPDTRPRLNAMEFDSSWNEQKWSIRSFCQWAEALGYRAEVVAVRAGKAKFKSVPPLANLIARGGVIELTPSAQIMPWDAQ